MQESENIMSISEMEAERQYPPEFWEGTNVPKTEYSDYTDFQQAYIWGREAPPTFEEINSTMRVLEEHYVVETDLYSLNVPYVRCACGQKFRDFHKHRAHVATIIHQQRIKEISQ